MSAVPEIPTIRYEFPADRTAALVLAETTQAPGGAWQGENMTSAHASTPARTGGSGVLAWADVAGLRQDARVELHIDLRGVAAALCVLKEAGATTFPFATSGEGTPMLAAAALAAGLNEAAAPFG